MGGGRDDNNIENKTVASLDRRKKVEDHNIIPILMRTCS